MNHTWTDNTCTRCGITRIRKEYKQVLNTYSILDGRGVFVDREKVKFGTRWWYGEENKFIRPSCKNK